MMCVLVELSSGADVRVDFKVTNSNLRIINNNNESYYAHLNAIG